LTSSEDIPPAFRVRDRSRIDLTMCITNTQHHFRPPSCNASKPWRSDLSQHTASLSSAPLQGLFPQEVNASGERDRTDNVGTRPHHPKRRGKEVKKDQRRARGAERVPITMSLMYYVNVVFLSDSPGASLASLAYPSGPQHSAVATQSNSPPPSPAQTHVRRPRIYKLHVEV
jgi:hypothetical protein